MPCSAVTLSLATICAVTSAALLGISFGTDNWQAYRVGRNVGGFPQGEGDPEINSLYLNRTRGLFRVCFLGEMPDQNKVPTYISPVETNCRNIDYRMGELVQSIDLSENEGFRLTLMRVMVAAFIVSFILMCVSFFTGLAGCWRRSPGNIVATASLLLFACIAAAGAMGFWHGVDYYEREKLNKLPFRGGWDSLLKDNSVTYCDWSYMLVWIGIGLQFVSSLLFAGASFCIRNEIQRAKAKEMHYMIPVYQQKQQYAAYGYGYPGPYHYGSQQQPYGHYNY